MSIIIDINKGLEELPKLDINEINEFQGDLKDLSNLNYNKLKKSLLDQGLLLPFFLWVDPKDNSKYLMDGHQRKRVWTAEGFKPIEVPYILVPGKDRTTAKKNLLVITSQFGTVTQEGYDKFTSDLSDTWKQQTLNFDLLYREFNPSFSNNDLNSIKNNLGESNSENGAESIPSVKSDKHSMYEVVMLTENKNQLEDKINEIKLKYSLSKDEEALMYLLESYENTRK